MQSAFNEIDHLGALHAGKGWHAQCLPDTKRAIGSCNPAHMSQQEA